MLFQKLLKQLVQHKNSHITIADIQSKFKQIHIYASLQPVKCMKMNVRFT